MADLDSHGAVAISTAPTSSQKLSVELPTITYPRRGICNDIDYLRTQDDGMVVRRLGGDGCPGRADRSGHQQ